jgi:hypothetical protein
MRGAHSPDQAEQLTRPVRFRRGFWNVSSNVCGGVVYSSSYAAFLDGCVVSFQKAWGPFFLENRINEYNLYAEDNWHVKPDLTLNHGVRYEYAGAPTEKENRLEYGRLPTTK